MRICDNCGFTLADDDLFCGNCGTKQEVSVPAAIKETATPETTVTEEVAAIPETAATEEVAATPEASDNTASNGKFDYEKEITAAKETAKELAGKATAGAQQIAAGAKDLAAGLSKKLEEKKASIKAEVEKEAAKQNLVVQNNLKGNVNNSKYMSSNELWSWLKKDAKRQQYYNEEVQEIEEHEFMELIAQKLADNKVPAQVEKRKIQWDRSNVTKETYFVRPITDVANPISCLVQMSHIGKFTFVEEKTFITPPELPEKKTPIRIDPALLERRKLFLYGIVAVFAALFLLSLSPVMGLIAAGIAGVLIWVGYSAHAKVKEMEEHNRKCADITAEWNFAWKKWQDSIFLHSFQEDMNGQLSRIYDAVFECIKQVSIEVFKNTATEEVQDRNNLNELEQLIERRKDDYR